VTIPYGTVEPWWISLYEVVVFSIGAVSILKSVSFDDWGPTQMELLAPAAALLLFTFLQTVSFPLNVSSPNKTISADVFGTRLVLLKFLALAMNAWLLMCYTASQRRMLLLIHAVIGVAVASALFGIARETLQHAETGFLLPYLRRHSGFGQFVNKNHFALLMEMGIGLGMSFMVSGGVRRERALIYDAALVLMWVALVLTASRGGLFSMFSQMGFLIAMIIWLHFQRRNAREIRKGAPKRHRQLVRVISAVALGCCLLAVVAIGAVWVGGDLLVTRMESLPVEIKMEASELHAGGRRRDVWGSTWSLIKSHPLVGSGFGAYGVAITKFHNASGKWTPEAAHNDYLELIASGGVVGACLVIWLSVVLIRRALRQLLNAEPFQRAACLGALTGIFGVMVHNVVDFGLHVTANAVIFLALAVIATGESRSDKFVGFSHGVVDQ
jgi:O-antigen ligase